MSVTSGDNPPEDLRLDLRVNAVSVVNNGPANVEYGVVVDGNTYPYLSAITPGNDSLLNLADFEGLQSGTMFTSRVIVPSTGRTNADNTELTYVSNVTSTAIYTVTGTAKVPVLNFTGYK